MNSQAPSAGVVHDLLRIHNERINAYTHASHNSSNMELDIKFIFDRIIEESMKYQEQLKEKEMSKEGNHTDGKIYKAWTGIKTPVTAGNRKTILANCLDDELKLLNVYSTALSFALDKDVKDLLVAQQQGIKLLQAHIKQYHDAQ